MIKKLPGLLYLDGRVHPFLFRKSPQKKEQNPMDSWLNNRNPTCNKCMYHNSIATTIKDKSQWDSAQSTLKEFSPQADSIWKVSSAKTCITTIKCPQAWFFPNHPKPPIKVPPFQGVKVLLSKAIKEENDAIIIIKLRLLIGTIRRRHPTNLLFRWCSRNDTCSPPISPDRPPHPLDANFPQKSKLDSLPFRSVGCSEQK